MKLVLMANSSAKLKLIGIIDVFLVVCLFVFTTVLITVPSYNNCVEDSKDGCHLMYNSEKRIYIISFGLLTIFGLVVGILSSMVLIKAASLQDIDKTEKVKMIALSLHGTLASSSCLILGIYVIGWVQVDSTFGRLFTALPILFVLLIRLIFAFKIWQEKKNLLALEDRLKGCEASKLRSASQLDYWPPATGCRLANNAMRGRLTNSILDLKPYKGASGGCHCIAPQGIAD